MTHKQNDWSENKVIKLLWGYKKNYEGLREGIEEKWSNSYKLTTCLLGFMYEINDKFDTHK